MTSGQQIAVAQLEACAGRLGRPPTQAQFRSDPKTSLSPREVSALWPGGWREALGAAGLKPGWDNQALIDSLKRLSTQIGRVPTSRDIAASDDLPSAAIYIKRFGSLKAARAQAGLTGIQPDSDQAMIQVGLQLAVQLGCLPAWNDWIQAREANPAMPSQWQVYRRFGGDAGAWRMFQYCLIEEGAQQGIHLQF